MKRIFQVLLVLAVTLGGAHAAMAAKLKLNSGKTVELLDARETQTPAGKALLLEYRTQLSGKDPVALRAEADELWERFVTEVERGGFKAAVIRARAPNSSAGGKPLDTDYQKVKGTWRAPMRGFGETVPFTEATIREVIDRQAHAALHGNFTANRLFTAAEWTISYTYPDGRQRTLSRNQHIDRVERILEGADINVSSLQYDIMKISIDHKTNTARTTTHYTMSFTQNGLTVNVEGRGSDYFALRGGFILFTKSRIKYDKLDIGSPS